MKIINCEQGTDEWFYARLGKPSASIFSTICTTKGKPTTGATRESLINKYVAEIISGDKQQSYSNAAIERGIELESSAADMFAFMNDVDLDQVGFILDDTETFGCSPDRIIHGEEIGLEIKCPLPHTHVKYLIESKLPAEYVLQVQGSMLVTGFKRWYFMSYCPNMPPLILLIERDDELCSALKFEIDSFNAEIKEKVSKIESM